MTFFINWKKKTALLVVLMLIRVNILHKILYLVSVNPDSMPSSILKFHEDSFHDFYLPNNFFRFPIKRLFFFERCKIMGAKNLKIKQNEIPEVKIEKKKTFKATQMAKDSFYMESRASMSAWGKNCLMNPSTVICSG